MTTTETTTTMDRFYELMDAITGGSTSEASLAACDMYAAALARIAQLEAAAKRYRELTFAAGFYGCPSCKVPLVLPALFPLTDDTEPTDEEYDDGPEVEAAGS